MATAPQDAPKSKDAILVAALKVFAQDGYDGASMPKIARMATVAPPLIHYYFGSKENLWRETVEYSLGELRREADSIRGATRALAPLDRLRVLLQALAHFAARCPDHFGMIIAEARSESDRFTWVQENYTGLFFEDVLSILREAKEKGHIKNVAIDQVALILIGGILIYFTVNPALPKKKDLDQLADDYTELMFTMLLEGLAVKKRER